nr:hypothetical protein [Tanacetum cinerariifolium]
AAVRNRIKSFHRIPGEQFHEAFSRLKDLLRTCPHHDVPEWELVKVFYDGLDYHNQQFVMATSRGMFFSRPMEEEWEFFEKPSKGSKTQASEDRNNNHTSSANFLSNQHGTNSEISELSKKVDLLLRNLGKGVPNVSQVSHNACSMCGWRNHPSFRWKDDDNYNRPNNTQQQNHGYIPRYEGGDSSNFQKNYHQQSSYQQRPQQYQNHGQGPSNGQQSNVDQKFDLILRVNTRETGKLPSYPDLNPKHKPGGPEHVNMVTPLRNGRNANNVKSDSELVNDFLKDVPKPPTQNTEATESPKVGEGVKINLPLIDAIKQIPAYAKFLKDLCTQKRKLKATLPKKIDLTEHVSAVLSSSLPPKFKDPGAPLISVVVGNITIKKAFLDLGASINILSASLVDKHDLGTLCKTDTIISLADRSTKISRGILEDVIVKVDDFYYPVDFFVMDIESPYKDVQPNIILGRPFLATIDARINCRTGAMNIVFGNRKLLLNVFNSLNSPILNDCYHIDTIDECIQTHTPSMNLDHTLENLHYVDIEKELLDGMMFHEKEEEFQLIEEEFLLSLEETPLQSQQVQQSTLNEVQEYVNCLLVYQDVLLRARGSNKGNGCVRKRSRKKMVRIRLRRKHRRIRVKIKKRKFLLIRNKKVDELFALGTITRMVASVLKTYSGNVHEKHTEPPNDH